MSKERTGNFPGNVRSGCIRGIAISKYQGKKSAIKAQKSMGKGLPSCLFTSAPNLSCFSYVSPPFSSHSDPTACTLQHPTLIRTRNKNSFTNLNYSYLPPPRNLNILISTYLEKNPAILSSEFPPCCEKILGNRLPFISNHSTLDLATSILSFDFKGIHWCKSTITYEFLLCYSTVHRT